MKSAPKFGVRHDGIQPRDVALQAGPRKLAWKQKGACYWVLAAVVGAIAPSIVALFVVAPLKGQPIAGGGKPAILIGALLLNGAWGIGVALLMAVFHPVRSFGAGSAAGR